MYRRSDRRGGHSVKDSLRKTELISSALATIRCSAEAMKVSIIRGILAVRNSLRTGISQGILKNPADLGLGAASDARLSPVPGKAKNFFRTWRFRFKKNWHGACQRIIGLFLKNVKIESAIAATARIAI
jgi:hypothetical protein